MTGLVERAPVYELRVGDVVLQRMVGWGAVMWHERMVRDEVELWRDGVLCARWNPRPWANDAGWTHVTAT